MQLDRLLPSKADMSQLYTSCVSVGKCRCTDPQGGHDRKKEQEELRKLAITAGVALIIKVMVSENLDGNQGFSLW